jgi:hypothetical protein
MTWARMRRLRFTGQFGPAGRDFAAAVAKLPVPHGVTKVRVDDRSFTDIFGCRIAVDMNATFDVAAEARATARRCGRQLPGLRWVPAFALYDLLRADSSTFLYWMGARQP